MTASVLARPEGGAPNGRASLKPRGPVVPAPRTPGLRVVWIDKRASVQFAEPFWFRIVRTDPSTVVDGWVWLEGHQLNAVGDAVTRRKIFVREDAVRLPVRGPNAAASHR